MQAQRRKRWRMGLLAAAVVVVLLVVTTQLLVVRSSRATPASRARPTATYEEALARVAELKARDDSRIIRPTIFMGHGSRVATAVVLFHGFTNNPQQFEQLGKSFYDAGYNVLIPRLPEHGQRDRLTKDLSKIDTARLVEATNEAVDVASGLGRTVEVVGLSGGGNMAALAARDRNEVTTAVIMSPLFGVDLLPNAVVKPIAGWSSVLPDIYLWWDPRIKEGHKPPDAYPRYSLKSMSAFFELAFDVMDGKPERSTKLDRVAIITNAADDSVREELARQVVAKQLAPHAKVSQQFEFPRSAGYAHDLIDPDGLNRANIEKIYGALYPYLGLTPAEKATE